MSRTHCRYPLGLKRRAAALRRQGRSLYELRDLLKVRLATIQGWVKDVSLSVKARERIRRRILNGGKVARARAAAVNRQKIEDWKRKIQDSSFMEINRLRFSPELGRVVCSVLYACEGSKYPSARMLGFANSDPRMIRLFLSLLRTCFEVDERRFRCQILYRCDQDWEILRRYWSHVTSIRPKQLELHEKNGGAGGSRTLTSTMPSWRPPARLRPHVET